MQVVRAIYAAFHHPNLKNVTTNQQPSTTTSSCTTKGNRLKMVEGVTSKRAEIVAGHSGRLVKAPYSSCGLRVLEDEVVARPALLLL